jgi:SAM-dependent methyltransferase
MATESALLDAYDPARFTAIQGAGYDSNASEYARWAPLTTGVYGPEVATIAAVGPGVRVLDAGCGTGNSSIPAAELGAEVVGIDLSGALLDFARNAKGASGIEFQQMDIHDLHLPAESFDAAVCHMSVGNFADARRALGEIWRVLAPGGTITVSTWIAEPLHGWHADTRAVPAAVFRGMMASVYPKGFADGHPHMSTFGAPGVLSSSLFQSKFEVDARPIIIDSPLRFRTAEDFIAAFRALDPYAAHLLDIMSEPRRARLIGMMLDKLIEYGSEGELVIPSQVAVSVARKPAN